MKTTPSSRHTVPRSSARHTPFGSHRSASRVHHILSQPAPQPKLTIGRPNDVFEKEADRVADAVLRMPLSASRPEVANCPEARCQRQAKEEEENLSFPDSEFLSMKSTGGSPVESTPQTACAVSGLEGRGEALDVNLRSDMEQRFGKDFGPVRIHRDPHAAATAESIGARAFTYRHHIAFAPGEYQPGSPGGLHLLAHELTHVLQQRGNTDHVQRACNCTVGRRATAAEHTRLSSTFPHLVDDDYCIIGPRDRTYNCIAWSVGDSSQWIWNQVDSVYGDNDGTVSISDFDAFYDAVSGLTPQQYPDSNTKVALFGNGLDPTHAAPTNNGAPNCGAIPFTSKLGRSWKIAHGLSQLEGGSVYGNVIRYYE